MDEDKVLIKDKIRFSQDNCKLDAKPIIWLIGGQTSVFLRKGKVKKISSILLESVSF